MPTPRNVLTVLAGALTLSMLHPAAQAPRRAKHPDMRTHGALASAPTSLDGTTAAEIALRYLRANLVDMGLTEADVAEPGITTVVSGHTGVTHVYLRQRYSGIDVHGADINLNVTADGSVLGGFGSSFVANLASAVVVNETAAKGAIEAAETALASLGLRATTPLTVTAGDGAPGGELTLTDGGIADQPITARQVYERLESGRVVLAWLVEIPEASRPHWWAMTVDAQTGDVLERIDQTVHDPWGELVPTSDPSSGSDEKNALTPIAGVPGSGSFRVYAWPFGDPNDGPRRAVVNPADPVGSPFGWNDTDGIAGPESTQTVGNNVDAYLDRANDNVAAAAERADGGSTLAFDFPLDLALNPSTYQAAALTNLYYWNNVVHDISYRYGFDEAAGNFQANQYGKFNPPTVPGGNDYVRAEAQDGGGMNNANFSTGTDGNRPRMQMFLWVPPGGYQVQVTTGAATGNYAAVRANFGAFLADSFSTQPTAQTVLTSPANACAPLVGFPAGSIAYVDAGTCSTVVKSQNAQNAGAVGIIIDTNSAAPVTLTGVSLTVNIPVLGVSAATDAVLRPALPFTAKMAFLGTPAPLRDGDLDAVVIAHEYTHGISNRLTGGRLNVSCLNNDEQMGEGWSDWIALAFTHDARRAVQRTRGLGPYIRYTGVNGAGIRPTAYATDMAINPTTYGSITTLAIPHGVGYAWATMLWDVYWNLIDKHGFNQNVYDPWYTGGNNLAIQLVMDGMKLQPCSPGFVNGRNAILQADTLLTGGANQCAIWKGFAKRGLGFSAVQGSSDNVNDGTEAFDLPAACRATLSIDPASISVKLLEGTSITGAVRVMNTASADGENLAWTVHEAASSCSAPGDVPWLTAAPATVPISPAAGYSKLRLTLDSTGLAPGDYTALLCVNSNAGPSQVSVLMRVKPR